MLQPFIRDEHIGYICIHFTDTDEYTRWGVSRDWQHMGEYTLAKSIELIAVVVSEYQALDIELETRQFLADGVVEAAAKGLIDVIPCRSSALIQALGTPFLLIEASREEEVALRVGSLSLNSAADVDALFDEIDAASGAGTTRWRFDTSGGQYVATPVEAVRSAPAEVNLKDGVQEEFAASLAEILDGPDLRAGSREAMQTISSGGHPYVH